MNEQEFNKIDAEKLTTIISANTTTAIGIVNINLPSAEEYRAASEKFAFQLATGWSEPKYQCPKCGGGMCKNMMVALTTYPVQYEYRCDKCGHIDYQYI